jgi:hypothetical protein
VASPISPSSPPARTKQVISPKRLACTYPLTFKDISILMHRGMQSPAYAACGAGLSQPIASGDPSFSAFELDFLSLRAAFFAARTVLRKLDLNLWETLLSAHIVFCSWKSSAHVCGRTGEDSKTKESIQSWLTTCMGRDQAANVFDTVCGLLLTA